MIKTSDGSGTIPDGFAIDLSENIWYLVEAELGKHSVWSHIAPQVSKQVIASAQPNSRKEIIELAVNQFEGDETTQEKFRELDIKDINVRSVLNEILEKPPVIAIPIDRITNDLRQWAETLKYQVKLWIINKFVEFGNESNKAYQFPDEFKPELDTIEDAVDKSDKKIAFYDVSISDLINEKIIVPGEYLVMHYKPKNGEKKKYQALIREDGQIELLGQIFKSPSYAALAGMQNAGSHRKTVNGWSSWKYKGKILKEIRTNYLEEKNKS